MNIDKNPQETFVVQIVWREDATVWRENEFESLESATEWCSQHEDREDRRLRFAIHSMQKLTYDLFKGVKKAA